MLLLCMLLLLLLLLPLPSIATIEVEEATAPPAPLHVEDAAVEAARRSPASDFDVAVALRKLEAIERETATALGADAVAAASRGTADLDPGLVREFNDLAAAIDAEDAVDDILMQQVDDVLAEQVEDAQFLHDLRDHVAHTHDLSNVLEALHSGDHIHTPDVEDHGLELDGDDDLFAEIGDLLEAIKSEEL